MTEAERKLWSRIQRRYLGGFMFYRQRPLGNYIADFFCQKTKLVIEIDGGQHFTEEGRRYDRERQKYLNSMGVTVLRFSNSEVLTNIEGVVHRILAVLTAGNGNPP